MPIPPSTASQSLKAVSILRSCFGRFRWGVLDPASVVFEDSAQGSVARCLVTLSRGRSIFVRAEVTDSMTSLSLKLRRGNISSKSRWISAYFDRTHLGSPLLMYGKGTRRPTVNESQSIYAGFSRPDLLGQAPDAVLEDLTQGQPRELSGKALDEALTWLALPSSPGWKTKDPVEAMVTGVMRASQMKLSHEFRWTYLSFVGD